jgi:uncharacterized membrane protein YebE (DUF533 family)
MGNLAGILGTMMASGLGGRSRRSAAFAQSPFRGAGGMQTLSSASGSGGMGMRGAAGLAALGYLAYKAYQDRQSSRGGAEGRGPGPAGAPPPMSGGDAANSPSLGDRLASALGMSSGGAAPAGSPYPEPDIGDEKALLLIRAMIAAANADGEISEEERRTVLAQVDEAGGSVDERRAVEAELSRPATLDQVVAQVNDPETAQQVYLASRLAIDRETPAERAYLQYLAARLGIDPETAAGLGDAAA